MYKAVLIFFLLDKKTGLATLVFFICKLSMHIKCGLLENPKVEERKIL
jgi:hypothetical protein